MSSLATGALCPRCDHGFDPEHLGDELCTDCQADVDEASYLSVEDKRRAALPICEARTSCRAIANGWTRHAPANHLTTGLVRTCTDHLDGLELVPFTTTKD